MTATLQASPDPLPGMQAAPDPGGPRVLGVDWSLTCTGLSTGYWTDTVKSVPQGPATVAQRRRISQIVARITQTFLTPSHALVVIEGPSYQSPAKGIRGVWDRAWLYGLLIDRIDAAGIPIAVVPPTVLKKYVTGKGGASKALVMREIARRFPWFDGEEDEADAMGLAAMGLDWLGCPLVDMPQSHRAALSGVEWPVGVAS